MDLIPYLSQHSQRLQPEERRIAEKVIQRERLTESEGVFLFERSELPLLGVLASHVRRARHDKRVYFNRNFHVEPTNVCIYDCKFCSYSRKIRKR